LTTVQHLRRVGLLMTAASVLLGWLATRTEVFFADGMRYINQAKVIDQGAWERGLVRSVDHPVYPLAIVATHRILGGHEPDDWQRAAQLAAVIAGVLAVIPIYLVAIELIGAANAWLACLLIYMIPINGHVMADAMSESAFLLFWCFGLWSTLKFLRTARLAWLPLVIVFSLLAYLTRPEGLVVPLSLLATLIILTMRPSLEFPRWSGRWALALLVLGPIVTASPFMLLKGGISTKPSLNRILSLAPRAPGMAVERERPLETDQSRLKTVLIATKAVFRAVVGATTLLMVVLAPFGMMAHRSSTADRRNWLLVATMLGLSAVAMIRLHETCGYCTPRHAMMVGWILITAGAAGLDRVVRSLGPMVMRLVGNRSSSPRVEAVIKTALVGGWLGIWGPATMAPLDRAFIGYRQAGEWLATLAAPGEGVIDLKGFSLYYAGKTGYTFANLDEGRRDAKVRWIITHDAHVNGPWDYNKVLRSLIQRRQPIRTFPEKPERGVARVYVFDVLESQSATAGRLDAGSPALR
jgi:4-amino-4-deoxy-L-arabinose transferase-like glycosyltransferase